MKKISLNLCISLFCPTLSAQTDSLPTKIPFDGMDMSWQNGNDRRTQALLSSQHFTGNILMDVNATYSGNNPVDNTVVGSTALARNNEMQLSHLSFGGDFSYKGARARFQTQFGTRSSVVPRNDYSAYRGQYNLTSVYRYLSESYAGYHFNLWHGINVDFGMFMSYIGLNSYYQAENWEYQASFTSDNTPWFFNGIRIQIFPTKHLKIEPWIVNGYQSYAMYNKMPGLGMNITWCPKEYTKWLTNNYVGKDAAGLPGRIRFHSDNSFLLRYYNLPNAKRISRMAFSLTADLGFEKGDGVNGFTQDAKKGPAQYFISAMAYHRIWFHHNQLAWTLGGGWMTNPGRYLVLSPTGDASPLPDPQDPTKTEGTHPFSANAGDPFKGLDYSTNLSWLPNQSVEFRLEWVHRESSVPYFAGKGGVTSPNGYTSNPLTATWKPDLVRYENRLILAILFRI